MRIEHLQKFGTISSNAREVFGRRDYSCIHDHYDEAKWLCRVGQVLQLFRNRANSNALRGEGDSDDVQ
jgi:hypothetical protein